MRICDGDVSVRSTVCSSRKNVACAERAGWPAGKLSAVEVVVGRLDLAPVDDPIPEAEEDVLDLAADLRHEVQPARRRAAHRKRDVDPLFREPAVELVRSSAAARSATAVSIRRFASFSVRPVSASAHLPQRERETPSAQVLDPHGLDLVGRRRRGDRRQGRTLERFDVHGTSEASKGQVVTRCLNRAMHAAALYDAIARIYDPGPSP